MRLKAIKLAGFKSFVDPTHVKFPTNMCAVVGPNGCGKSNIIDAVRWVMGESSAKNLRGDAMTDVIFSGSNTRKPVGQASIELVFDNSSGKLGGEYARFSEISIKRKLTREGQSTYYLNNTACRKRDITDVFLGTGLGPRSYSIIEQGMISKLVESKPDELRAHLEEAAGISKYKERRKETESRIRRTKDNLERLADIREETERQLQHLQRQAQAAEKYAEYKADERRFRAELLAVRWQGYSAQLSALDEQIRETEITLEQGLYQKTHLESALETLRLSHTDEQERFDQIQRSYYATGSEIARAETDLNYQRERLEQIDEELSDAEQRLLEADSERTTDLARQADLETELEQVTPQLALVLEQEQAAQEALAEVEEEQQAWQHQWDHFNETAADAQRRAELFKNQIQNSEANLQRLTLRRDKLQAEREQMVPHAMQEELAQLQEEEAEHRLAHAEQQQGLDQHRDSLEQLREQQQALREQREAVQLRWQQLKGRQASLDALQQAAMESGEAEETAWLEQQALAQAPRLADSLSVTAGWETAVEAALGPWLKAVCVDALETVAAQADSLKKGAVHLLESGAQPSTVASGPLPALAQFVQGSAPAQALLAQCYGATSVEEALGARQALPEGGIILCQDGTLVGRHWLRRLAGDSTEGGVIQRKQALQQIATELAQLASQREQFDTQLEALNQRHQSLNEHIREAESAAQEAAQQQAALHARISAMQTRVEQTLANIERIEGDIEEQAEGLALEKETLQEHRLGWQQAVDELEQLSDRREALMEQRDNYRDRLDHQRQQTRHLRDQRHHLQLQQQSAHTQLGSLREALARLDQQSQRLAERKQQLQEEKQGGEEPLAMLADKLEVLLDQRVGEEEKLARARDALTTAEQALRENDTQRQQADRQIETTRQALQEVRLQRQALDINRTNLNEQLAELEQTAETVLAAMEQPRAEADLQTELERIDARIKRLGAINLAAIDEYKAMAERKDYLDKQNDDLVKALDTLEDAIRKIDKETRSKFKETFDKVNDGVKHLFPKLFGGGEAYLELTGDDLLDTGVTIMARPPGKKNSTIHLLSGGEKALTAVAMVFSIFQLNPAPFCMLDEVDAPLDDANVGRYADMVKEMSDQVQFIYITHNKIAMEKSEQLMGVTMHEPGVSRLVSVDVEEAVELATA